MTAIQLGNTGVASLPKKTSRQITLGGGGGWGRGSKNQKTSNVQVQRN